MFKKLLEHNITSHDGQFFCHLCMIVQSDLEDILHHVTEEKHQLLQSEQTNNVLENCKEQTSRTLIDNNIAIITLNSFYCIVCQSNFTDLISTLLHVQSRYHIDQLKKNYVDINYHKDKSSTCIIKKKKLTSFDKSVLLKDTYQDYNLNVFKRYHEVQFLTVLHNYSNEDCKVLVNNKILKVKYYRLMCQYCYRCCLTLDDILQHVKATKHTVKLTEENITLNKKECKQNQHISVNSEVMKNIMNLNLSKVKETDESIFADLLQYVSVRTQQKQDTNISKKLLYNNLTCKLCTCHLPSLDHILQHVKGRQHVSLLKIYDHIFLSNKIITQGSNFICTLCAREIDTLHNTLQHIEGKSHTNKLKYLDKSSNTAKIEHALCTNSNSDGSGIQEANTDIFSEKLEIKDCQLKNSTTDYKICSSSCINCLKKYNHIFLSNKIITQGSNFICTLCARKIDTLHNTLQHIEGKFHANKLKYLDKSSNTAKIEHILCTNSNSHGDAIQDLATNFLSNETKDNVVTAIEIQASNAIIFNKCLYYCELCGIQINIKNVNKYINTLIHKNNIPTINVGDDTLIYKCFCCKSIIQGTNLLINHLNSAKHLNNLTNTLRHSKVNDIEIFTQSSVSIQNMLKDTKSSLYSVIFPEVQNILMNLFEKQFIFFDISNMVYSNIKNKMIYFCSICSPTLETTHNLSSSCKSLSTITDNYFKIPSNINAEIIKLIHDSPFNANRMKVCTYKEVKPVKHLNKIYSERYLEIEEIMYTIDKRKLDNIKLNFKPFMPYNAKQFYCLVCNINVLKDLDLLYEHACLKSHKMNVNIIENDKNSNELLKQYMQKISNDSVKCHICRSCIKNDTDSIDAHINNKMHKKKYKNFHVDINNTFNSMKQILSSLWYSIQKFSCVLCSINFNYKIEFIEHIISIHNGLLLNQMFDFCIPCATLWLNSSDCYTEHCNDIMHKYLIKNKDFMIGDLPECIKKLLRQVDKTDNILSEETQVLMNDSTHQEIIQSLKKSLNSSFPLIEVYLFGSRITGFESVDSVMDIFLDCGTIYYSDYKQWLEKGNLEIIEEIIRTQTNEWEVKEEKGVSRTVIKLLYKRTRVQCNIFITNSLSIENFKLIRSFNDSYPPCKKLISFITKWLSCFDLPSKHGLINCAIAWLVIFYLQLNSYLPSVATLIKQKYIYKLTCGSKTDVAQPENSNKSMQSISLLLLEFFQFYANFDYQHYIICPFMGYALAKKAFVNLYTLPNEMRRYVNYIRESNNPEHLRIDSPLCVQDPLDLSRNLTKAVTSITLKYFKQYCQDSASILQQNSVNETKNAN